MKNGVFHCMISLTASEIFTILYYANKITDVRMFSQRDAKTQNE